MLISRSPLLSLSQAAKRAGVCRWTVATWVDYDGLCAIRDARGRRHVREAELMSFLAERRERQAARRRQAEQRHQERQVRRERWLAGIAARHGLVPASDAERDAA